MTRRAQLLGIVFILTGLLTLTLPAAARPSARLAIEAGGFNPGPVTRVQTGRTTPLKARIDAGLDFGIPVEIWLTVTEPDGLTRTLTRNGWVEGETAYTTAPLADIRLIQDSPPLVQQGRYTFSLILDRVIDGLVDGEAEMESCRVLVTPPLPDPPVVDVEIAPGDDAPPPGSPVGLRLSVEPGQGTAAMEWWLAGRDSAGRVGFQSGWTWAWSPRPTPYKVAPPQTAEWNVQLSDVGPPGRAEVMFGLDPVVDGKPDPVFMDSASVMVAGAQPVLSFWLRPETSAPIRPLGQTPDLELDLFSGGFMGLKSEIWLAARRPSGDYLFHNGRKWVPAGPDRGPLPPLAAGPMADVTTSLPGPAMNEPGVWIFCLGMDALPNGRMDRPDLLQTTAVYVGSRWGLSLEVNGRRGSLGLRSGDEVEVTVNVSRTRASDRALDWWLVTVSPSGETRSLVHSKSLMASTWEPGLRPWRQQPALDFTDYPLEGNNLKLTEAGRWSFFFSLDRADGEMDARAFERVIVEVTELN